MKLSELQITNLVKTADLLDRRGLFDLANDVDSLLRQAADPEPEKPEVEEAVNTDEVEEKPAIPIDNLLKKFIGKFYKNLLDTHTKFTRLVNKKELGHIS